MYYPQDGGWASGPGGGWIWGAAMMVGMLALLGLAAVAALWLVRDRGARSPTTAPTPPAGRETPVEILERRLASGELSVSEYHERRAALQERELAPDGQAAT